tara:strand:- start:615 stop:908 length:294 start_codon:yes stop_codon:yes gene_type:complete
MIPNKWCVKVYNLDVVKDYLLAKGYDTDYGWFDYNFNFYLYSEPLNIAQPNYASMSYINDNYKEISFSDFEKYVLNKSIVKENNTNLVLLLDELNIK